MESKYCDNCREHIPKDVIFLFHYNNCKRFGRYCELCKFVVPHNENNHDAEYHITCECGEVISKESLKKHKEVCTYSTVKCEYCEIDVPIKDLTEHLGYCGSRTNKCSKCGKWVILANISDHGCDGEFMESPPPQQYESMTLNAPLPYINDQLINSPANDDNAINEELIEQFNKTMDNVKSRHKRVKENWEQCPFCSIKRRTNIGLQEHIFAEHEHLL